MTHVALFYAGCSGLMLLALSVWTIFNRGKHKQLIGDGGADGMLRAIRAQGNFVEYTPMMLILAALLEMQGTTQLYLHLLCTAFLLGRIIHAYAILVHEPRTLAAGRLRAHFRPLGIALTFTPLAAASIIALFHAF